MTTGRIVVIDDERDALEELTNMLRREFPDKHVDGFVDPVEAVDSIRMRGATLVLTDLSMPEIGGREVLEAIRDMDPNLPVVILTGWSSLETAQDLTRIGADDFIAKPFRATDLGLRLHLVLERRALRTQVQELRKALAQSQGHQRLLGRSKIMVRLHDQLPTLAASMVPVLIEGESGTGKEMVARQIHALGPRSEQPFVAVNCGALPENLVESELFGFRKGTFTGAMADSHGLVRQASGGTLFLDEIGDLPPSAQVKLLRFLQEGTVRALGEALETAVDVRVLAATNARLAERVAAGSFREDLYYRLRVLPVVVPPLRERVDDIPLLARSFLAEYAGKAGRAVPDLRSGAIQVLTNYPWPGNVRELQNCMQRLAILVPGSYVNAEQAKAALEEAGWVEQAGDTTDDGRDGFREERQRALADFEAAFCSRLLQDAHGNVSRAAREARMDRKSLWRILKRRGIDPAAYRPR